MLELRSRAAFTNLRTLGSSAGVTACERTGLGIANVMVRKGKEDDLAAKMQREFGLVLPHRPCRVCSGPVTALGVGPGKWIVLHEGGGGFVSGVAELLQGAASVTDQSGALGVLRLSGPALPATLEKGLQIDVSARAFPSGSAAVMAIAHVGVTLWKLDETPTFEIAVARSLADSFLHWLEASAAMHGLHVVTTPDQAPNN